AIIPTPSASPTLAAGERLGIRVSGTVGVQFTGTMTILFTDGQVLERDASGVADTVPVTTPLPVDAVAVRVEGMVSSAGGAYVVEIVAGHIDTSATYAVDEVLATARATGIGG